MESLEDRPIEAIWYPDLTNGYKIGDSPGITKISLYYESGQMAGVPWFTVWKGNDVVARCNAAHIALVIYAQQHRQ